MKLTAHDKRLLAEAKRAIVKARPVRLANTGDVGAALVTSKGRVYRGVCLGFYSGIGSCGEYQAVGSMISNGEKEVKAIVAVWYDRKTGRYTVIPPCGKCREMLWEIGKKGRDTEVIISATQKVPLRELLPHPWGKILAVQPGAFRGSRG